MERQGNVEYFLHKYSGMNQSLREDWITRFRLGVRKYVPGFTAAVYCGMWDGNIGALEAAIRSYKNFISKLPDPEDLEMNEIQVEGHGDKVLHLLPNTKFSITWNVENTGDYQWPPATHLALETGFDGLPHLDIALIVPRPLDGQSVFLQAEMVSPVDPGIYTAKWRLMGPSGKRIGDALSVTVVIDIDDCASALCEQFAAAKPFV